MVSVKYTTCEMQFALYKCACCLALRLIIVKYTSWKRPIDSVPSRTGVLTKIFGYYWNFNLHNVNIVFLSYICLFVNKA